MNTNSLNTAKYRRQRVLLRALVAAGLWISILVSLCPARAQIATVPAQITEEVDTTKLATLRGNTHPLARPEYDRGPAPDGMPMERILLVLKRSPEQEAGLRHLLDEQQTKGSGNFHHWLTPEEFGRQFGPADSDLQAVTNWLASEGFEVKRVAAGRTVIEFSGNAGLVRQALGAEIHQYDVKGETRWANATDPMIPSALAPVVAGFDSLNSFPKKPMHHVVGAFRRSKATGEVRPLFTLPFGGSLFYGVGPTDFATIYNVLPLWNAGTDGTGQTIAIVGDSNINIKDIRDFRSMFGLPANDPQIILDGPDPGLVPGSETEADLDVEWAGAVAKNATIDLVVSEDTESTFGADLSALYIVDNNLAPVLSVSFGLCEAQLGSGGNLFYNSVWEQAAAQGITVSVASGDSGSDTCDAGNFANMAVNGLSVSGTASTPFNVALGGTDFNDVGSQPTYWNATNDPATAASAKSYIPEEAWNDSCARSGSVTGCASGASSSSDLTAGGGGPSSCASFTFGGFCLGGYAKPAWQTGTGVPIDSVRDVPDLSLFAADGLNGSFYIICAADQNASQGGSPTSCDLNSPFADFLGVGGTSASAPSFAGIMALVNQAHGRQGNANYVLYALAAQANLRCTSNASAVTNTTCTFYDTVTGNNSVACAGGTPNCSTGTSGATGILTTTRGGTTPAFNNTAGYDLATGLGTVNAANLVKNWTNVSFHSTSTMLALSTTPPTSPITLTHGQPVNVTINVTSGSGTPTGDVSLLGGPAGPLGIDAFTLSSGAVMGKTTNLLPGGTYNVTAHYAGTGTFGASDSPPVQVTVNKESSRTAVSLVTFDFTGAITSTNATTAPYGSPYILRVDVTNGAGQLCATNSVPCPTGQVTITDNGGPLPDQSPPSGTPPESLTLNGQAYAEDQFIQFPAGTQNVVATYQGDNGYTASSPTTDVLTITKAITLPIVGANPTTVAPGGSVTLIANIGTQSSGVAPTGTVNFLNGTTRINGTPSYAGISGTGCTLVTPCALLVATLTTTFSSTASVTAQYSGDSNYATSTSAATTVTVSSAADFNLSAPNPASFTVSPGQSGASTIAVSPLNAFSGTVSFSCVVAPVVSLGPGCSLSPTSAAANGSTTLTVTTTAPSAVGPLPGPNWFVTGGATFLLGLLLLLVISTKKRRLKLALGLLAAALLAAALIGCGGGSSSGGGGNSGTPAGTYTITVTGTSGTLSHTATVSVTVT